jgi:hypothetical protein
VDILIKDFDPYQSPYTAAELKELRAQTQKWRAVVALAAVERGEVDRLILECRSAGFSYERIRSATGFGTGTIQQVVAQAEAKGDTLTT